jgi:hypothetical protein
VPRQLGRPVGNSGRSFFVDEEIIERLIDEHSFFVNLDPESPNTTRFWAFVESKVPLDEGCIPLIEGFTERRLSGKASRRSYTDESVFAESMWDPLGGHGPRGPPSSQ